MAEQSVCYCKFQVNLRKTKQRHHFYPPPELKATSRLIWMRQRELQSPSIIVYILSISPASSTTLHNMSKYLNNNTEKFSHVSI